MSLDLVNLGLYTLAAFALLGSPGPAIAALLAVGRAKGFLGGLPFFGGLLLALAVTAGLSAAGLFSLLAAVPHATLAMTVIGTAYLLYLAYAIATAPVGRTDRAGGVAATPLAGALLGFTNPKAYLSFLSLMASPAIARSDPSADLALKWLVCMVVIVIVDLAWLWVGGAIGRLALRPAAERIMNVAMGATVALSALLAFL